MKSIRVHPKAIVLVLNRREANALMTTVTPYGGDGGMWGNSLIIGKDMKAIKSKLEAAIAGVSK